MSDAMNQPSAISSDYEPQPMSAALQNMSDISPDIPPVRSPNPRPATSRITLRIATETLDRLDAEAAALGATRSDYIRTMLMLPVKIDVEAISRAQKGKDTVASAPAASPALVAGNPPFEVQAITDSGLAALRSELNRIGVNYNQSVRALNRINRKYANRKVLPEAAVAEFMSLLERLSKQNGTIFNHVTALEDRIEDFAQKPSIPLHATKGPASTTPINNSEAQPLGDPNLPRPHRVRGRKHPTGSAE